MGDRDRVLICDDEAQILRALGVCEMVLLSNTRRTVVGLEGHGLSIVGHRPLRPVGE